MARCDSWRIPIMRLAYSSSTSPAGVSRTAFPTRPKSFSPYSSSSWRICALTADCERNTLRPASEKLPFLATSTKVVSWSKSMELGCDSNENDSETHDERCTNRAAMRGHPQRQIVRAKKRGEEADSPAVGWTEVRV